MFIKEGEEELSGKLNQLTDITFECEVLNSDLPVVVDFWADWCQPCLRLADVLEEVSLEYLTRAKFYGMNVDENQKVPIEYIVKSVPTLLFFKDGQVVECLVGNQTKDKVRSVLNKLL